MKLTVLCLFYKKQFEDEQENMNKRPSVFVCFLFSLFLVIDSATIVKREEIEVFFTEPSSTLQMFQLIRDRWDILYYYLVQSGPVRSSAIQSSPVHVDSVRLGGIHVLSVNRRSLMFC